MPVCSAFVHISTLKDGRFVPSDLQRVFQSICPHECAATLVVMTLATCIPIVVDARPRNNNAKVLHRLESNKPSTLIIYCNIPGLPLLSPFDACSLGELLLSYSAEYITVRIPLNME